MLKTNGYAAYDAKSSLKPFQFERREPGPQDVHIEILYCGVCHTDVHQARDEWGGGVFPMVPGHEIVGRVLRVGGEAEHGIVSEIELIAMQGINQAYERMVKSDVKYRFVIDMATLAAE